jgi:hypothetical protein
MGRRAYDDIGKKGGDFSIRRGCEG